MAVAGKGVVSAAVKPIFSRDLGEAKRRVRELYRAWYREVPNTGLSRTLPVERGQSAVGDRSRCCVSRSAPVPAGHHGETGAEQGAGDVHEERSRYGSTRDRHAGY
ncbi:NADH dehydrogenase [ubiquinone] 1 alpha subcomplex subunit 6 isoform X3 [Pyrgilauda ruficollis]|uniref:NADH dehydrogenase [ubiquinone] 1 alpha subcomplex subunit 6 isoform X3 n=1 Tax=Pyrgilauda ruficollis TaxID=221976 RepID=UPI001B87E311|nr:NADH dehydrogenase [ubiquinone] 1 alpha subcomplex subunit 6 isoform X3 [Pyrgilauda ruficollis]XP_041337346.1 NADH dehydrogenase [ubiquinone] 1 alpha subcomplex subunit 6 isoform X3 [Pyrgilauda ruficollis]